MTMARATDMPRLAKYPSSRKVFPFSLSAILINLSPAALVAGHPAALGFQIILRANII
jgi:hypothetical protein